MQRQKSKCTTEGESKARQDAKCVDGVCRRTVNKALHFASKASFCAQPRSVRTMCLSDVLFRPQLDQ